MTSLGYFVVWALELLGQTEILWDLGGVVYGIIYNQLCYLSFDVVPPILSPQRHCINSTAQCTGHFHLFTTTPHNHGDLCIQQSKTPAPYSAGFLKHIFPEATLFHIYRL